MDLETDYSKTGFLAVDKLVFSGRLNYIFSEKLIKIEKIPFGNVNRNYRIIAQRKKYFCKISPLWYENSLRREAWALRNITKKGGIVPAVISYFDKNNNIIPQHEILILEYISGKNFFFHNNKVKFYKNIFNSYNIIHSIKMCGFGWLDSHFIGRNKKWIDFLMKLENIDTCRELIISHDVDINYVFSELSKFQFKLDESRLLYGDYNYYNFIITNDEKLYSLDLQNCFAGDPAYDIGIIIAKDNISKKHLKYLDNFSEDKMRLIYLYALRHLLSILSFYIINVNQRKIGFAIKRFLELERKYKKLL